MEFPIVKNKMLTKKDSVIVSDFLQSKFPPDTILFTYPKLNIEMTCYNFNLNIEVGKNPYWLNVAPYTAITRYNDTIRDVKVCQKHLPEVSMYYKLRWKLPLYLKRVPLYNLRMCNQIRAKIEADRNPHIETPEEKEACLTILNYVEGLVKERLNK